MIISALFIFAALVQVPAWAKVVDTFYECREFFYENTEPQGMDQNAKKICQKFDRGWVYGFYYASLYSTYHRIPVYSAYTFNPGCISQGGRTRNDWFIEPQLSGLPEVTMKPETNNNRDRIKVDQALNGDYCNTGYDRGHLNPNSFQCDEGREATFTLTNSAPMDACFNRVSWYQWEKTVKDILKDRIGTAYLVTGTVPSPDYKIPRQDEYDSDNAREFSRVTVPSHIWTAVCFEHHADQKQSFSFGYIGLNQPDSWINVKTVPQLNEQLTRLYGASEVEIFKDDCFSENEESEKIVKELYKKVQLPFSDRLAMSDNILEAFHTAMCSFDDEDHPPSKKPKVTGVKISETYDSLETWFEVTERMKYVSGSTCVLSQQFIGPIKSLSSRGIQKRDITGDSQELVCSLVPEKVSYCTTSCLYKKEVRDYYCYDGIGEVVCSPEYSIVTVKGNICNSDHTCGKHGEKYYWCRVGRSWEYCSPPLPIGKGVGGNYCRSNHNCGWYNKGYTWCFTDYNNNWDYCCRSGDDRFSALNGKTCKPDHPCGYYSYRYLWCYTTDGSSERCCTQ